MTYNGGVKRFAALLLLAIACSNERPLPPVAPATEENKPQDGGTVVRRLEADVSTLNPILADSQYDRYVDHYLFTPLVELDSNLQPIPGIAQSWDISKDG